MSKKKTKKKMSLRDRMKARHQAIDEMSGYGKKKKKKTKKRDNGPPGATYE